MIAEERRALLLKKLQEDGYIQVTDLAEEFDISSATIRRDLIMLEQEGICVRKRGGAVRSTQSVTMELPYDVKQHRNIEEKSRIAKAAINLVEDGDTILLDAGSTIFQLASLLHTKERLTVGHARPQYCLQIGNQSQNQPDLHRRHRARECLHPTGTPSG